MKTLIRAALLLVVFAVIGAGLAVWYVQRNGMSARGEPTAVETAVALQLRHLSIPAADRDRTNPLKPTADNMREGMEHYADHCAMCHANSGNGDTAIGMGLYPKPPVLRDARTQSLSDGELFSIIDNGIRFTGMPAFGGPGGHDVQDSWRLVLFIRHLPSITDQELKTMETMNPKAPDDKDDAKPGAPAPHHHGG